MGLTENIVGGVIGLFIVVADITLPTATVDVTQRTTGYVCIRTGREVFCTENVINGTRRTCCINIFVHGTTKQGDICRTIDITASNKGIVIMTKTTTVGIVTDVGSLLDNNVGVVTIGLG